MAGRSRVFWAGPVSKTSSFSGLLSSSMVVSIRDLLGRDGFGGACLHRDFSFFPCNFIFSSSPLVACGWSSLNGAGLISLIKIGLLQSSPLALPSKQRNQAWLWHSIPAPEGFPTIWGVQEQTCLLLFQGLIFVGA